MTGEESESVAPTVRKPKKTKIEPFTSEQIRELANQYLQETPSVQRKTLRDHIFALKDDIIQKRKDGVKILDLAFAYKKAYDAFSPTEASLDYLSRLISEVSKEAFPYSQRSVSKKQQSTAQGKPIALRNMASAEETISEARRLREERAQSGAKPSPFPPGYVDRNLDDL